MNARAALRVRCSRIGHVMAGAWNVPVLFASSLAVLCGAACTRLPQREATERSHGSAASETDVCGRSTAPGYSDPATLAREFVERDGAGETASSRTSRWFLDNHYCPVGLPGWDVVTIVKEATVDSVVVSGPEAYAYVTYRRIGSASGASFTAAPGDVQVTVTLVRIEDGWRLNTFQNPHFLVSTALSWPTHEWPDSVRELIERLARD